MLDVSVLVRVCESRDVVVEDTDPLTDEELVRVVVFVPPGVRLELPVELRVRVIKGEALFVFVEVVVLDTLLEAVNVGLEDGVLLALIEIVEVDVNRREADIRGLNVEVFVEIRVKVKKEVEVPDFVD
jgi:hypothetical protein